MEHVQDASGMALQELERRIEQPTLLLDRERAMRNIERMAEKARRSGVRLRPHFKTHQSARVGEWFRAAGVDAITVSSVDMAAYFADHGWDDITIAFPANIRQLRRIDALAAKARLGLTVESIETAAALGGQLQHPVDIWIKIDTGYGRTGLVWNDTESIAALARSIDGYSQLQLKGILCHAGHSYRARGHAAVEAIYNETVSRMQAVRQALRERAGADALISIGDTPTCSVVERLHGVDEIRPGNFVFFDLTQLAIGACAESDIAVALACPVVAKHPARGQVIIYGGAVHLSKDTLALPDGTLCFGQIARRAIHGWGPLIEGAFVTSVSQEHGIVSMPRAAFDEVQIGDLLYVVPVHSCLTADLMKRYLTLDGETITMMRPA